MGEFVTREVMTAFVSEVQFLDRLHHMKKEAAISGAWAGRVARGLGRAGKQFSESAGPFGKKILEVPGSIGKAVSGIPESARETLEMAKHPLKSMREGWAAQTARPGKGWMGEGKALGGMTRYLPIGQKSMLVGFAAPGAYESYKAFKEQTPTPTGEGGGFERGLGELGSSGGFLAGMASKKLLPGLALMAAGGYAGGKMGRIIDRLRGGANLRTAVSAPSPTEVESQVQDIERYYG